MERHDVVIIGAGQAGLATSRRLAELGIAHVILEAGATAGDTWRSRRWDAFTLVTPNKMTRLPGLAHRPDEPDVFIPRDEVAAMLHGWGASFGAPLRTGVRVEALDLAPGGGPGYRLETSAGPMVARAVVVATGFQTEPVRAPFADRISGRILQLTVNDYKRPEALPPGGVLVVGSGQSGVQIAEDLALGGRDTWISVGGAGRVPRRYRGRDIMDWLIAGGRLDRLESEWPDPRGRFAPNPALSGARGGHTTNLHRFARDGMHLLGHLTDADGERLTIAPDLHETLAKIDRGAAMAIQGIDEAIAANGIPAPAADPEDPGNWDEHFGQEGFDAPVRERLDLAEAGIGTIVWASGLRPGYPFVRLRVFDATRTPRHEAGLVPDAPGLAFMGVKFQRRNGSDLLWGVADDAAVVADGLARHLGAEVARA